MILNTPESLSLYRPHNSNSYFSPGLRYYATLSPKMLTMHRKAPQINLEKCYNDDIKKKNDFFSGIVSLFDLVSYYLVSSKGCHLEAFTED